jgi:hypothetical protein
MLMPSVRVLEQQDGDVVAPFIINVVEPQGYDFSPCFSDFLRT